MDDSRSTADRLAAATVPTAGSPASNVEHWDVFEAVMSLSKDLELTAILRHTVEHAKRLSNASYAALGMLDESGTQLGDFVYDGISPEHATRIGRVPEGRGLIGELIGSPNPIRLDDLTVDPRSCGFPPEHPPMRTFLGVPITIGTRCFGNLYVTEKADGTAFTDRDEAVVMMLASAAGAAIHNAQLYEHSLRHRRWLEATKTITSLLLGGARPEDVLTEIANVAQVMAKADECGVRLVDPTGHHLQLTAAAGVHSEEEIGEEMLVNGTFLGKVFTSGTTTSTSDLQAIAPTTSWC